MTLLSWPHFSAWFSTLLNSGIQTAAPETSGKVRPTQPTRQPELRFGKRSWGHGLDATVHGRLWMGHGEPQVDWLFVDWLCGTLWNHRSWGGPTVSCTLQVMEIMEEGRSWILRAPEKADYAATSCNVNRRSIGHCCQSARLSRGDGSLCSCHTNQTHRQAMPATAASRSHGRKVGDLQDHVAGEAVKLMIFDVFNCNIVD